MIKYLLTKGISRKTLTDNFPDAVIALSIEGEIITYNKKALEIFEARDLHGVKIDTLIPNGLNIIQNSFDTRTLITAHVVSKDGLDKYFEVSANYAGNEKVFVATFRDVGSKYTKNKQLVNDFETFQNINYDKNTFLAGYASELTSPIQSVVDSSNALLEGIVGKFTQKQIKYLQNINKNSKIVNDFFERLVILSKFELDIYNDKNENFDVLNLLKTTIKDYQTIIKDKDIEFNFDSAKLKKKTCFGNEKVFRIIFSNFIESAINSTDIGNINIKIANVNNEFAKDMGLFPDAESDIKKYPYLLFTIEDTGNGFTEEEFENIFNPYKQLENGHKNNILTSLGFAVTQYVIHNLNGKLWGQSKIMQGSTFSFLIPTEKMGK